jgi:hypothetical protein
MALRLVGLQNQRNIPGSVFIRKMGALTQPQMAMIVQATQLWLGIL